MAEANFIVKSLRLIFYSNFIRLTKVHAIPVSVCIVVGLVHEGAVALSLGLAHQIIAAHLAGYAIVTVVETRGAIAVQDTDVLHAFIVVVVVESEPITVFR